MPRDNWSCVWTASEAGTSYNDGEYDDYDDYDDDDDDDDEACLLACGSALSATWTSSDAVLASGLLAAGLRRIRTDWTDGRCTAACGRLAELAAELASHHAPDLPGVQNMFVPPAAGQVPSSALELHQVALTG